MTEVIIYPHQNPVIRFSHRYEKMPGEAWVPTKDLKAKLLEVFLTTSEELSKEFISYDTTYFDPQIDGFNNYPLPRGKVIVLLLKTEFPYGMGLWTTVRRWTEQKELYYRSMRGKVFDIEINYKPMK